MHPGWAHRRPPPWATHAFAGYTALLLQFGSSHLRVDGCIPMSFSGGGKFNEVLKHGLSNLGAVGALAPPPPAVGDAVARGPHGPVLAPLLRAAPAPRRVPVRVAPPGGPPRAPVAPKDLARAAWRVKRVWEVEREGEVREWERDAQTRTQTRGEYGDGRQAQRFSQGLITKILTRIVTRMCGGWLCVPSLLS